MGKVETKILRTLALKPDLHTQAVKKALNHDNYSTVMNAMKRLNNTGLVTFKWGISKKNLKIKLYKLSDRGERQVLMNETFSTEELDKIIENYSENARVLQLLKKQHKALGTKLMAKILRHYAELGKSKHKGENGQAQVMLVSTLVPELTKEDAKKMDNFIDNFTKQNPRLKKKVRAWLKKRRLL